LRILYTSSAKIAIGLLLFPLLFALQGCGGRTEAENAAGAEEVNRLSAIEAAYFAHIEKTNRPPKSADDLKKYFAEDVDVSTVYTSSRDNEPYVIFWGADYRKHNGGNQFVIAYEKTGVDGVRMVLTGFGVVEMNAEQLGESAYPPGGSAPAAE